MSKQKTFLGTGWSFPPQFENSSGTVKMVSDEEDIRQSIYILLSTTPGERVTNLAYGCNLHRVMFAKISDALIYKIKDIVKEAIIDFEPRVEVVDVEVDISKMIDGVIYINLIYEVLLTNTRYNIVFPYYQLEGTNVDIRY